jgi:hypothetical protein
MAVVAEQVSASVAPFGCSVFEACATQWFACSRCSHRTRTTTNHPEGGGVDRQRGHWTDYSFVTMWTIKHCGILDTFFTPAPCSPTFLSLLLWRGIASELHHTLPAHSMQTDEEQRLPLGWVEREVLAARLAFGKVV